MNNETQGFYNLANDLQEQHEELWQYVQSLTPETVVQMSQPQSHEVKHVMERNIVGLLGNLNGEGVDVSVNMSRESLGRLLGSAMMSGYFLRNAEQRLNIEKSLEDQEFSFPE
ncbi:MAG: DUF760 domain-containing protein [Limnothrix sp.]